MTIEGEQNIKVMNCQYYPFRLFKVQGVLNSECPYRYLLCLLWLQPIIRLISTKIALNLRDTRENIENVERQFLIAQQK